MAEDITGFNDGDQITTAWPDASGNSRNATPQGSPKPLYKTNQINSLPAVYFGGACHFTLATFMSGYTSGEVIIVAKRDEDPSSSVGPLEQDWGSSTGSVGHWPYSDGTIYETFGSTGRHTVGNPSPSLTSWRTYNVRSATNAYSAHLDGLQIYSSGSNTVGFYNGTHLIGYNRVQYFVGHIAEIIFYNRVLTDSERETVYDYLESKYALTIASSSPSASRSPSASASPST
jgi:hypothetical protein